MGAKTFKKVKIGISVLIPTYNRPQLLRRAVESVVFQTRLPDEVLIFDDNVNSHENYLAIKDILQKYAFVKYKKNERRLGIVGNYLSLLKSARFEYIKFLADDDWLHPEALERMSEILDSYKEVGLVTSTRIPVNLEGEIIDGVSATRPLASSDKIFEGKELIVDSIEKLSNIVGGFSTYMFRKSYLDINPFKFCGIDFRANADWVLWMYIASKSKIYYLSEALSVFTIHESQDQKKHLTKIKGLREHVEFLFNKQLHSVLGVSIPPTSVSSGCEIWSNALKQFYEEYKDVESVRKECYSLLKEFYIKYSDYCRFQASKNLVEKVSVIVVSYNSRPTIAKMLKSVLNSLDDEDEIILIDNNSQDGTQQVVKSISSDSRLKLFFLKKNVGYAPAVNYAVQKAKNEILVFANPDTIFPENWKHKIVKALSDSKVGAVGVLSNKVINTQLVSNFTSLYNLLCNFQFEKEKMISLLDNHLEFLYRKSSYKQVSFLSGFFLATKRKIFEKVGGFNSKLFLGMDDLDYALKLRRAGYELRLMKNTFIYHRCHVSFERSSQAEKLCQETTNLYADILIDDYGFGNVPNPEILWGDGVKFFRVFVPTGKKYRFMFKFKHKPVSFVQGAKILSEKPTVGLITVTYYSSQDVKRLAFSLSKQSYKRFFWIIIDNSEDEEELDKLRKTVKRFLKDSQYEIVPNKNTGYAGGNNLGLFLAAKKGIEYVWILNPDVELPQNAIMEMLKNYLYSGADVLTCKIKDSLQRDKLQYDGLVFSFNPFDDYLQRIHYVNFLTGASIFSKTRILLDVGFDERFFLYFEDNKLKKDLEEKGYLILYTPFVYLFHRSKRFPSSSMQVYYFCRNALLFYGHVCQDLEGLRRIVLMIKRLYLSYLHDKKTLKAIILAIYDGTKALEGRTVLDLDISFKVSKREKEELKKRYFEERKISKFMALKAGRDYLLVSPKDVEIFLKFLNDSFTLIKYKLIGGNNG